MSALQTYLEKNATLNKFLRMASPEQLRKWELAVTMNDGWLGGKWHVLTGEADKLKGKLPINKIIDATTKGIKDSTEPDRGVYPVIKQIFKDPELATLPVTGILNQGHYSTIVSLKGNRILKLSQTPIVENIPGVVPVHKSGRVETSWGPIHWAIQPKAETYPLGSFYGAQQMLAKRLKKQGLGMEGKVDDTGFVNNKLVYLDVAKRKQ